MKKKLLVIGLIAMLGVNLQASSLQETIASNPGTCAAIGYAVGTIGYNLYTSSDAPAIGRALTFHFNYTQETKSQHGDEKKVSEVHGVDLLGCTTLISNIQKTNYEGNISKDIDDIKGELYKLNQKFLRDHSAWIGHTQKNKIVVVALDPQAIATGLVCAGIAYYALQS